MSTVSVNISRDLLQSRLHVHNNTQHSRRVNVEIMEIKMTSTNHIVRVHTNQQHVALNRTNTYNQSRRLNSTGSSSSISLPNIHLIHPICCFIATCLYKWRPPLLLLVYHSLLSPQARRSAQSHVIMYSPNERLLTIRLLQP